MIRENRELFTPRKFLAIRGMHNMTVENSLFFSKWTVIENNK